MKKLNLSIDSQERLLAYTTAAGFGAFFAGQSLDAQVVESAGLAPYPHTIIPGVGVGPYGAYHYFSVDGGKTNFNFSIDGPPLTTHPTQQFPSQAVNIYGFGSSPNAGPYGVVFGTNSTIIANSAFGSLLTPTFSPPDSGGHTNNSYAISFLGGSIINATTASAPHYQPRIALCYFGASNPYGPPGGFYSYINNWYQTPGNLAFEFTGSSDGQTHFGYMEVEVNSVITNGIPQISSVIIEGIYYNATPNASITVPTHIKVSGFELGAAGAVTINFTSNDASPASSFTLQTSPTLGASANWQTDPNATISLITGATPTLGGPNNSPNRSVFQAVTTATGGAGISQFYRVIESN